MFNALVLIMLERFNNGAKGNNKGKGSLCGAGTLICSALSVCFHAFILGVISFTLLDHVSSPGCQILSENTHLEQVVSKIV